MSQVVACEFCTTNANDIRGTASSTEISKNIDSDTVDQLKGDLPELHLKLSDGNKTQHLGIEGGAYPVGATNIISPINSGPIEVTRAANISQNISEPIEVTVPNDAKHKVARKKKKDVTTKKKPKQKVSITPTYYQPVKPPQFIGFYVCKEFDGVRTLGTVDSYDHKNNLFKVEYDDCRIEYLEQNELEKNRATDKDISKAQEELKKSNDSKKNGGGKKKNPTSGERSIPGGSTPTRNNNDSKKNDRGKRKISTSGDRSTESPTSKISRSEKNEYRLETCRMRASNQCGR